MKIVIIMSRCHYKAPGILYRTQRGKEEEEVTINYGWMIIN